MSPSYSDFGHISRWLWLSLHCCATESRNWYRNWKCLLVGGLLVTHCLLSFSYMGLFEWNMEYTPKPITYCQFPQKGSILDHFGSIHHVQMHPFLWSYWVRFQFFCCHFLVCVPPAHCLPWYPLMSLAQGNARRCTAFRSLSERKLSHANVKIESNFAGFERSSSNGLS